MQAVVAVPQMTAPVPPITPVPHIVTWCDVVWCGVWCGVWYAVHLSLPWVTPYT